MFLQMRKIQENKSSSIFLQMMVIQKNQFHISTKEDDSRKANSIFLRMRKNRENSAQSFYIHLSDKNQYSPTSEYMEFGSWQENYCISV